MHKLSLLTGTLFAFLSVIIGAFGAHYLKTIFTTELLISFETGVRYQMYHAFALILAGILATKWSSKKASILYLLFTVGIVLFSGSIYILCLLKANGTIGIAGLGMLTPFGGICFLTAWLYFYILLLRSDYVA
jgi:uncharacterized membrane protein YgdD (TMEM256/DUF423 family)